MVELLSYIAQTTPRLVFGVAPINSEQLVLSFVLAEPCAKRRKKYVLTNVEGQSPQPPRTPDFGTLLSGAVKSLRRKFGHDTFSTKRKPETTIHLFGSCSQESFIGQKTRKIRLCGCSMLYHACVRQSACVGTSSDTGTTQAPNRTSAQVIIDLSNVSAGCLQDSPILRTLKTKARSRSVFRSAC